MKNLRYLINRKLWDSFASSSVGQILLARILSNSNIVKIGKSLPQDYDAFISVLHSLGIRVTKWSVDICDYQSYVGKARYADFPHYYANGKDPAFIEKTLEHYVATKLLDLSPRDVYLDIASGDSPVPDIVKRMFGCQVFRQDLAYPSGLNGEIIGGDAAHMPLPNESITKMALHCSFEHFEGDSDIGLIREAARVLRHSGKLCILPLYTAETYSVVTDPQAWFSGRPRFESDATVYFRKGYGQRHARHYDVDHFLKRIFTEFSINNVRAV